MTGRSGQRPAPRKARSHAGKSHTLSPFGQSAVQTGRRIWRCTAVEFKESLCCDLADYSVGKLIASQPALRGMRPLPVRPAASP